MPAPVRIIMKLDASGFNFALRKLRENTRSLPSSLVNRHVRNIAWQAYNTMPVVPISTIESDMEATAYPEILKSGARSTAKKKQRSSIHLPEGGRGAAAMIVIASMWPDSKYNRLTGRVFQRSMLPPSGTMQGAWRFWQEIDLIAQRMVKARRSSAGFFKTCAGVVASMFTQAASRNSAVRSAALTGMDALPNAQKLGQAIGRLAGGTVAVDVGGSARATFWVASTEPESKGADHFALYTIAQPVWQKAIAGETWNMLEFAKKNYDAAAEASGFAVH